MIPATIKRRFPLQIRERGEQYFGMGRVRLTDLDDVLTATVTGTEDYHVLVDMTRPRWRMECTCPYAEEHDVCKHIWAVLLADERGLVPSQESGAGTAVPERLRPVPVVRPEWQRKLSAVRNEAPRAPLAADEWPANRRISYQINVDETVTHGQLVVDVVAEFMREAGRGSGMFTFTPSLWLKAPDEADRTIAHLLLGSRLEAPWRPAQNRMRFLVPPQMYSTTMRTICETGRCTLNWKSSRVPDSLTPIRYDADDPWELVVRLAHGADEGWHIEGVLLRNHVELDLDAPVLLTPDGTMVLRDAFCRYTFDGPWGLLRTLQSGSIEVPDTDIPDVAAELHMMPGSPRIELPASVKFESSWPTPTPHLRIEATQAVRFNTTVPVELSFDYEGHVVRESDRASKIVLRNEQRIIHRNRELEEAARARLEELGAREAYDWRSSRQRLGILPRQLDAFVSTLTAEGWHVWADGKQYRPAEDMQFSVNSGIDWFDLEGGITYGNERVPLPRLLNALRKRERAVLLDDGTFGVLPQEWLERYAGILTAGAEHEGAIRFTRAQTLLLDALLATLEEPNVDATFQHIRDRLHGFEAVRPADPPPSFQGELRHYQREGLGWMHFLREFHLGGCLADDMGLGKTVQVLALLEERRVQGAGPSLVVVPKSLVFNWQLEAARFAPELRVRDYTGTQRSKEPLDPKSFDLLITTYGTLRRDAPKLRELEFEYVILDEAQAIKNSKTASAKAARLLRGRHRLAMTGTPIENRIDELWSLFEFLNPGMLGAASVFSAVKDGAESGLGALDGRALLARTLRPFILRRTKEQVAPELPPRTEQTVMVDLESAERKLYDELRDHYRSALLARVDEIGIKRAKIEILEALLRLRQAACHPALVDKQRTRVSSSKLEVLVDQLQQVIAEGHKALVFSQFTSFLSFVRSRLEKEGIAYEYLDGKTRDRQARVEHFQSDPDCPVFLISLKAGGYGLNLTAADYVFVLDPWWNPAVEAQAIDRTHRIGQTRHVMALRLIARDTVEEKVLQLQAQKRDLADAILSADAGALAAIGREELALLLG